MAGRASFAGSSSNLLSRSRPTSVHEKKQNVPTAVAGGSLHMPSNFARGDWALAVVVSKPSRTRMTGADCCFRRLIESYDSSMELFGSRADGVVAHETSFGVSDHPGCGDATATPPHEEGIGLAASSLKTYFASGSGRTWNLRILLVVPFPPSTWNGVRVAKVVQTPFPFQPARGSSIRPSIPFA